MITCSTYQTFGRKAAWTFKSKAVIGANAFEMLGFMLMGSDPSPEQDDDPTRRLG